MKKLVCLVIVGLACISVGLFAQSFDGGGYTSQSIEPITVADLANAAPNDYIVVCGTLVQQNAPGIFVLTDDGEEPAEVLVRIDSYAWSNMKIDATIPVVIYGIVLKKYMNTEVLALRVDVAEEQ